MQQTIALSYTFKLGWSKQSLVTYNREPFTIKLTYKTTTYTQPLTLGVDTGIKHQRIVPSSIKKL